MPNLNKITSKIKGNIYSYLLKKAINNKTARKVILKKLDKKAFTEIVEKRSKRELKAVQLKKYQWVRAIISQLFKNCEKGYISFQVLKKILEVLGSNNFFKTDLSAKKTKESFKNKYKIYPSNFIVVSPTQRCHLRCENCYASSSPQSAASLPFDIFDKILKENHDILGSRFVTISGGEPLMYKSQGKNLLDIFEKYNDTLFLFFTNGTLITKKIAERLVKTGNVYPQISIEGFEKETDEERGQGVFQRILKSIEYLKEAGVPFIISATTTKKNINSLLNDEFYNFWFEKQGASYIWLFHLMPIGRGKKVFNLMPSPEERVKLYRKWEKLLENGYPVTDFWNSAILSDGCIAYGRPGNGYFHIDWNGHITPCVFIPYYVDNVYDLYKKGKTIADALFSDFFKKGRKWQERYGCNHPKKAENWLMPCSIKDNYKHFRKVILPKKAKGENKFAEEAKNSKEYFEGLVKYSEKLKKLTQPIWDREYKNKDSPG